MERMCACSAKCFGGAKTSWSGMGIMRERNSTRSATAERSAFGERLAQRALEFIRIGDRRTATEVRADHRNALRLLHRGQAGDSLGERAGQVLRHNVIVRDAD